MDKKTVIAFIVIAGIAFTVGILSFRGRADTEIEGYKQRIGSLEAGNQRLITAARAAGNNAAGFRTELQTASAAVDELTETNRELTEIVGEQQSLLDRLREQSENIGSGARDAADGIDGAIERINSLIEEIQQGKTE